MTKYQPLTEHLAALAMAGRQTVEFDFAEIAEMVGGLPASASTYRAWWANDSKVEAEAWRAADWHVDMVHLDRRRVRFVRGGVGGSHRRTHVAQPAPEPILTADLERLGGAALDLRLQVSWQPIGAVTRDPDGRLRFADPPRGPGIYRLILWGRRGQARPEVYIGEAQDLRRRWSNYRHPGPTQHTSVRVHAQLLDHLGHGGQIALAVATSATLQDSDRDPTALPLTRKTARVLAEHAAVALEYLRGETTVLNLDKEVDDSNSPVPQP